MIFQKKTRLTDKTHIFTLGETILHHFTCYNYLVLTISASGKFDMVIKVLTDKQSSGFICRTCQLTCRLKTSIAVLYIYRAKHPKIDPMHSLKEKHQLNSTIQSRHAKFKDTKKPGRVYPLLTEQSTQIKKLR